MIETNALNDVNRAAVAKDEYSRKLHDNYGAKLTEHLKVHPEYDTEIAQTPMTQLMANVVMEIGPELGQALIDDKQEARRICTLTSAGQIFALGRLSTKLPQQHFALIALGASN